MSESGSGDGSGDARGPQRIGELVAGVLEKSGVRTQVSRIGVLEEWEGRVGERIAAVTRPRSVSGTALVVEVRSSAWLMELSLMKHEILKRVNAGRGDARIEKIIFVLGEDVE
ncbi:DUF721 domain-containing protein [Gemmatimonadota bacterium]